AQGRKALLDIASEISIAPGSGTIINAQRVVGLDASSVGFGWREADFPERHSNLRMNFSRHEDFGGTGQRVTALRLKRIPGRDHNFPFVREPGQVMEGRCIPSPALPGSGSTGLPRSHAALSAFAPP